MSNKLNQGKKFLETQQENGIKQLKVDAYRREEKQGKNVIKVEES